MKPILFAILAVAILPVSHAGACSVYPYQGAESVLDGADLIFVGKAIRSQWDITGRAVEEPEELVTTTFRVRRVLKGAPGERIDIIHNFPITGNCGIAFAPGQTALVFAVCEEGRCATDIISMGLHLKEADRAKLLSLLNMKEPHPFEED
ncbi:MAG: hypothetical protein ACLFWF_06230 [Alphaproteobacteria bacterium]